MGIESITARLPSTERGNYLRDEIMLMDLMGVDVENNQEVVDWAAIHGKNFEIIHEEMRGQFESQDGEVRDHAFVEAQHRLEEMQDQEKES